MRLITLAVATVVALTGVGWFAGTANAAPQTIAVEMANFAFSPAAVEVHAGDTVTWTNHDTAPHDVTVTSGPVAIHSPLLSTGQTWSYTFTTPGTYDYICSIHPDMHAAVTVLAAPTAQTQRPAPVVIVPAVVKPPAAGQVTMHMTTRAATTQSRAVPSPTATTSSAAAAVPVASSAATVSHPLKPLLIVAGVVAAVATFCLLVLASRPDEEAAD